MQLIIFIGIQATGKTSFFKERFFDTHIRISLDLLRTRHREKMIFDACIDSKTDMVIDNTNPLKTDRDKYINPAKKARYEVIGYYFASDLKVSLERNSRREANAIIPDIGVLGTYKKLEIPSYAEGFDKLYYVKISDNNKFNVEDWKDEI
ncbi:MAG TPA: kinase [Lentisphaeria bacterium]|nr:MAG: kinase [Lentisphaerae bacterium GWF2_38_69]HBM14761.1 kinase [Lentisphaeria bacterium]